MRDNSEFINVFFEVLLRAVDGIKDEKRIRLDDDVLSRTAMHPRYEQVDGTKVVHPIVPGSNASMPWWRTCRLDKGLSSALERPSFAPSQVDLINMLDIGLGLRMFNDESPQ